MTDDPLFDEFELSGHVLDNRVGLAPMTRTSATDAGHATDRMARYYASFARGGFSFLVTEGVHPDATHSQGYLNQPGLATDEQAAAWERVVDAVHEEGSPIFAQLMHAGAQAQGNRYGYDPVAPSPYRPPGEMAELYGGSGAFPRRTHSTTRGSTKRERDSSPPRSARSRPVSTGSRSTRPTATSSTSSSTRWSMTATTSTGLAG